MMIEIDTKHRFYARMAVTAVSMLLGALTALDRTASPLDDLPPEMLWFYYGIACVGLVITPFLVAGSVHFQCKRHASKEAVTKPSHSDNPFSFRNPHRLIHFVAFLAIAHGAGRLLSSPFGDLEQLAEGCIELIGGGAALAGLHLGIRSTNNTTDVSANDINPEH
jgi:hypothetical protein